MIRLDVRSGRTPRAVTVLITVLTATRATASEPVTAIDVLLLPHRTMANRALPTPDMLRRMQAWPTELAEGHSPFGQP